MKQKIWPPDRCWSSKCAGMEWWSHEHWLIPSCWCSSSFNSHEWPFLADVIQKLEFATDMDIDGRHLTAVSMIRWNQQPLKWRNIMRQGSLLYGLSFSPPCSGTRPNPCTHPQWHTYTHARHMDYRSLSIGNCGTTGSSAQCCRLWPTSVRRCWQPVGSSNTHYLKEDHLTAEAETENVSLVNYTATGIGSFIFYGLGRWPTVCLCFPFFHGSCVFFLSSFFRPPPKREQEHIRMREKARNRCLCYLPLVSSWRYLLFSRSCNDPSLSVALVTFIRVKKKAETAASTRRKYDTYQTDEWWVLILVTTSNPYHHPLVKITWLHCVLFWWKSHFSKFKCHT